MNGFKYLFAAAAVLILIVFGLTRFGNSKESNKQEKNEKINVNEHGYSTVDTTVPADEPVPGTFEGAPKAEEPVEKDPEEADNTWAMYLINNENPLPDKYDDIIELEQVDKTYREYDLDKRAAKYYIEMKKAAEEDGVDLITASAYRTYVYQQSNFDNSLQDRIDRGMSHDEAYADTISQVELPGKSEHNAGLAVDILSNEHASMDDDGFKDTEAFKWLDEHAAEYGFILRYPEGKTAITGIIYEPWHYRFVGKYYAKDIKDSGLCMEEYFEEKGWLDEDGVAIDHTIYTQNPDLKEPGKDKDTADGDDSEESADESSDEDAADEDETSEE